MATAFIAACKMREAHGRMEEDNKRKTTEKADKKIIGMPGSENGHLSRAER